MDITNNVSYGNTENISGGAINDIISSDDIDLESSETSSSGITSLNGQTMAAGTTLFFRTTAITLTSGIGIGYREHDGNASA